MHFYTHAYINDIIDFNINLIISTFNYSSLFISFSNYFSQFD